ncbi:hypothetical protein Cfor_10567 [Coptotermes formosanus]|jgi:gustatory receptor|uniref:Gustatory receptor n=1 Tax=Coptotermes formosanus TaxID=36987 RepID=A0A6L2Q574_COPFO|nr:hypothetical protein Cfor_10567 [Coptotermes formosanus]
MNNNTSDDFFLAIRPLLFVSRALGLAPFTYVKKTLPAGRKCEQLEHSSAALIYSIFVAALCLCLILISIILKRAFVYTVLAETDAVLDMLLCTVSITSLVSLALGLTTSRNTIVRIMRIIVEIDLIISESYMDYYKRAKNCLIVQLFVTFIFVGFKFTYDYTTWGSTYGLKVLLYGHTYVDTLVEWLVVLQFMNMVIWLKDKFSLLNRRLSILSGIFETENSVEGFYLALLKKTCSINIKEVKPQITQKDILTFNSVHDMLCDTVLLVKSTYEVQIFFSLLSTFVCITILLYFGLCFLYGYVGADSTGISASRFVVCSMIGSLLHVAKLLCITIPCHSANNKMAHTSTLLRKLLLAFHGDPGTMRELERFSKHVALRKFKFTVFGFLSLDLSLLVSMMGAVATYLVILMQFKMSINASPACSKNVTAYVSDNAVSSNFE